MNSVGWLVLTTADNKKHTSLYVQEKCPKCCVTWDRVVYETGTCVVMSGSLQMPKSFVVVTKTFKFLPLKQHKQKHRFGH